MDKSKKKYTKKVVDKFYPSFCRIQVYRNQKKQILKISVKEIIMDIGYKGYSSTQEFPVNRELNKKFFEFYKNNEYLKNEKTRNPLCCNAFGDLLRLNKFKFIINGLRYYIATG